ncbi:hypothetical protein RK21_01136 [Pseudomonas plecoglossicida]|nr:hypothetical protein RK21_01136 [Pseudomonas plecoglossicida]
MRQQGHRHCLDDRIRGQTRSHKVGGAPTNPMSFSPLR